MNIGINEDERKAVADVLHKVLANQHVLYQKLRKFHWNVKGKSFFGLHRFFEEVYTGMIEDIDVVAERIQSLGFITVGTMTEFLEMSKIKEAPGEYPKAQEMVSIILEDLEQFIVLLRESLDKCDASSEGVLTELLEKHEKQAWMLRSLLEE